MRGLRESAKYRFGSLWVAGTLALALSCVPAVALAEENAGAEAPTAPDPVALTQGANDHDAGMLAADGGTDSPASAMPSSNDADVPDVVADGADALEPSEGDGGDSADEPADPDPVQPAEPIVPGLKAVGDRFQYVNDDGSLVTSDWKTVDGKRYYFDSEGLSAQGVTQIDGNLFWFGDGCSQSIGWYIWPDETRSFFSPDASKYGAALESWQIIDGNRYYFDPKTCRSLRWEQRIDGALYYFDRESVMQTGWVTWAKLGTKSYFNDDGKARKGWQTLWGKRYYFDPKTCRSLRWEQRIDGVWYYFNRDSSMHTGWLKWSGKQLWSYYWSDGMRATGTHTIAGRKFVFDANGRTSTNPTPPPSKSREEAAMDRKAQNYSSSTNYMILVNRSTHKVGIYYKRPGYWECTNYFSCVTGKPSTPTITGSFKTTGGKRSSLSTDSRARYCTQITGGYFFHTILASNNELGKSLSHGCVRLSYSSAKWIYQHINAGTRVVIY